MNMTQHNGGWNILQNAEAVRSLPQWTASLSAGVSKAMQQVRRISKAMTALFTHSAHVSSMQVTWAGVLRTDCDELVPESSEEVRFQIANQMFLCEEGKRLVFDDTWNPDAWHDTKGYRVVFKTSCADSAKRRPLHRLQHWITNFGRHFITAAPTSARG